MEKQTMILLGTALVSISAGAAGGYLFAKRQLEQETQTQLAKEIQIAKDFYAKLYKTEYPTPADAAKDLLPQGDLDQLGDRANNAAGAMRVYQGRTTKADAAKVVANIFDADPPPDPGPETPEPGRPRIIDEDQFMANDTDASQVTLTYYVADEILADERDEVIDVANQMVGLDNLRVFHDAPDTTTIYVRNQRLDIDYEIVRSTGAYSVEVAGLTQ